MERGGFGGNIQVLNLDDRIRGESILDLQRAHQYPRAVPSLHTYMMFTIHLTQRECDKVSSGVWLACVCEGVDEKVFSPL